MNNYIVINKSLIEDKIKDLEYIIRNSNEAMSIGNNYKDCSKETKEFMFLKKLLSNSFDAQEVFNSARQCSEEYNGGGVYNILSYCGDEPIAEYPNYEEYTKTLNI